MTPWVDVVEECGIGLVYVDGTQYVEVLGDSALLEKPLHFKTTSTGIVVGEDVKDYPKVPPDWYRNTRSSHTCSKLIGGMLR